MGLTSSHDATADAAYCRDVVPGEPFSALAGIYLLLRPRLRIGPALVLTGTTLSGLLVASLFVFWGALAAM